MARIVFFSFHYRRDVMRVQVRLSSNRSGLLCTVNFRDGNLAARATLFCRSRQ
jgi:hypothetical protein